MQELINYIRMFMSVHNYFAWVVPTSLAAAEIYTVVELVIVEFIIFNFFQ